MQNREARRDGRDEIEVRQKKDEKRAERDRLVLFGEEPVREASRIA